MSVINFICPKCGKNVLIESLLVRESWSLENIYEDDFHELGSLLGTEDVEYENPRYKCNACKYSIPVTSSKELRSWLKERNMLILEEDDINEEDN